MELRFGSIYFQKWLQKNVEKTRENDETTNLMVKRTGNATAK